MSSEPLRRRQGGFSMIEVLIALVVLAVGLLGLALLQTMNLRYTKSAQQRTQAVNLASELLDTMRINSSEVAAYAMEKSDFDGLAPDKDKGCNMDSALTSANNVTRWKCEVVEALGPGAWAEVKIAGSDVEVIVHWNEDSLPDLDAQGQVTMKTTL